MARLIFLEEAEQDLDEITTTTQDRWGDKQAQQYRALILDATKKIARNPRIGQSRSYVRPGVFAFHTRRHGRRGRHIIFYRITLSGTIEVLRILHEARDFVRHLSVAVLQL